MLNLKSILKPSLLNKVRLHHDISTSLVFAPHPDDESLGCGGTIALLTGQNVNVYLVFITDGGHSHPNSQEFPKSLLIKRRKIEAIEASNLLGVPRSNLLFLELKDGFLDTTERMVLNHSIKLVKDFVDANNIQSFFIPYREDAHADHRATWKMAMKVREKVGKKMLIIEYPIWLWHHGMVKDLPNKENYDYFEIDVTSVLHKKKRAIAAHLTQTTTMIDDDPEGFVLTAELQKPFLQNTEIFFFQKNKIRKTLSRNYFDDLYATNIDPWNFRESNYEKSKYEKTLSVLNKNYDWCLEIGCSIGVFTNLLAKRCRNLLAVDISDRPLLEAKYNCRESDNVIFRQLDASKNFPDQKFDLITLCEVGYYLVEDKLKGLFNNCQNHLNDGGQILLVHWTSYVRDYPLTGKRVHEIFERQDQLHDFFRLKTTYKDELYELQLWQKL